MNAALIAILLVAAFAATHATVMSAPGAMGGISGAQGGTTAEEDEKTIIRLENTLQVIKEPTQGIVDDYVRLMAAVRAGKCKEMAQRELRLYDQLRANIERSLPTLEHDGEARGILEAGFPIRRVAFGIIDDEFSVKWGRHSPALIQYSLPKLSEAWGVNLTSNPCLGLDSAMALALVAMANVHEGRISMQKEHEQVHMPLSDVNPTSFDFVVEWGASSSLIELLFAGGFEGKALVVESDPVRAAVRQYLLRLRGIPVMSLQALMLAESGVAVVPPGADIGRVLRDLEGTVWLRKRKYIHSMFAALAGPPPPSILPYVEVFELHVIVGTEEQGDELLQSTNPLTPSVLRQLNALPEMVIFVRVNQHTRLTASLGDASVPALIRAAAAQLQLEDPLVVPEANEAIIKFLSHWMNAMFSFSHMDNWELGAMSFRAQFHLLAAMARKKAIELERAPIVCEIGFNRGSSALAFLLGAVNAHVMPQIFSFDLGMHEYVDQMEALIHDAMATITNGQDGLLRVYKGNSEYTVPYVANELPGPVCDIVYIDGGHYGEVPFRDLVNMRALAAKDAMLLVDDCMCTQAYCVEVNEQVQRAHRMGVVRADTAYPPMEDWFTWGLVGENGQRAMCALRYDDADKKRENTTTTHMDL